MSKQFSYGQPIWFWCPLERKWRSTTVAFCDDMDKGVQINIRRGATAPYRHFAPNNEVRTRVPAKGRRDKPDWVPDGRPGPEPKKEMKW